MQCWTPGGELAGELVAKTTGAILPLEQITKKWVVTQFLREHTTRLYHIDENHNHFLYGQINDNF